MPQQVFVFVYTNALLAKFVFEKSVIASSWKMNLHFWLAIHCKQCLWLSNLSDAACWENPNPPLVAEIPSAAARFTNAFCSCKSQWFSDIRLEVSDNYYHKTKYKSRAIWNESQNWVDIDGQVPQSGERTHSECERCRLLSRQTCQAECRTRRNWLRPSRLGLTFVIQRWGSSRCDPMWIPIQPLARLWLMRKQQGARSFLFCCVGKDIVDQREG